MIVFTRKGKANRNNSHYGSSDMYKYYTKRYGNSHSLSQKQFGAIIKDFFEALTNKMIFENLQFNAPGRLGTFSIRKKKTKATLNKETGELNINKLPVDYKTTRELWERDAGAFASRKKVYHTNKHSDRYMHKFYWDKSTCLVPNYGAYAFIAARSVKAKLTRVLKNDITSVNYYELCYKNM